MQNSKTHFDQIPVELVKKIAKKDVTDDKGRKRRCGNNNSNQRVEAVSLAFVEEKRKGRLTKQLSKRTDPQYGMHEPARFRPTPDE